MNKKLKITLWSLFFTYFSAFLVLSATMAQIDPAPRYHVFGEVNKMFADMSFWTTQTNWMFFIFFIFVALDGKWGIWKPGKVAWINFLAYFTLTMALFWSALSATLSNQNIDSNPLVAYANVYNSFLKWFITVTTHLVTYIIAITYYIVVVKKEKIDIKSWYKKDLLVGWIYPIFYLLFVSIRMLIMFKIGLGHYVDGISEKDKTFLENNYEWVLNDKYVDIGVLATPYFFFNPLVAKNGLELFVLGTIGCLLLITACQYLMIVVNNALLKEKKVKEVNKNFEINRAEKIFSYIKLSISTVILGLAIYKLTIIENYNFKGDIQSLYYLVYPLIYIFAIIANIATIILTSLRLKNKYNNPTLEFLTSTFSGLFMIQVYGISILIFIPIVLERIYKNKKIPSLK
ncbi:hypothetical protein [Spiroplasma sp. BIUS-1]|uniref:hypothetical protein n=1 Tax=Spiroplasma sp. BIUS-1 TaxID=216964 RepID=UPI0013973678|nr:hypothetical protein [Spiroplasma sp. BIUS-1]QHX36405.1 hypothetical protein SBIUS_v1c01520 [Spiroplasma sp. BIUS-1]